MKSSLEDATNVSRSMWDVIVIGTGMGGSTLGYALAKAGKRVLFCEKGKSHIASHGAIKGTYPEQQLRASGRNSGLELQELLRRAGRYVDPVIDKSGKKPVKFIPFIGSGTGGSSALYGMALERFFPSDFTPHAYRARGADESMDKAWPISYDTLSPYYTAAEKLYRIRGTSDPLRGEGVMNDMLLNGPPLGSEAEGLFRFFQDKGLHPYRLPLACESVTGCQCCQGILCPRQCKNDSARICLVPAIENYDAVVLDECTVIKIEADRSKATAVLCSRHGETMRIRGKLIVLAAGALQTPNILLRSISTDWPNGLANDSDMVGRNLMRHFIDLYLIEPERPLSADFNNRYKDFAFNDFYEKNGVKLGSVQSFGQLPPASMLIESMKQEMMDGPFPFMTNFLSFAKPVLFPVLNRMVNNTLALATILEDMPNADNRVFPATGRDMVFGAIEINYKIDAAGQERIDLFRREMAKVLKSRRWRLIKQAQNNQRIAHVCGTCRFGMDPKTSVLDRNNRAHGLENLYVADSSFFPTSGGTNPSLTIAANALRMADQIMTV